MEFCIVSQEVANSLVEAKRNGVFLGYCYNFYNKGVFELRNDPSRWSDAVT